MQTLARWALLATLSACAPEAIETVVLTPESPEIEAALLQADARWEAAGIAADRIVIGPGGAPVTLVSRDDFARADVTDVTRVIGRGGTYVGVRSMKLTSLDVHRVAHELGHAIGVNRVALDGFPHIDGAETDETDAKLCEPDAPNRPLMCEAAGPVITSIDLARACSVAHCTHFKPEAD